MFFDTIAAIATPFGKGAVSMIRISGSESVSIADKLFIPKNKKLFSSHDAGKMVYGDFYSDGKAIDDCLCVFYKSPHSYTGEDSVEIYCHGGIFVSGEILRTLFNEGAVQAGPGEFSKRAFINGKLTLSEAESVINTIEAKSRDSLLLARSHRNGIFSKETNRIYDILLKTVSSVYAYADYPDEDLADMSSSQMAEELEKAKSALEKLLSTYKTGKAVNEGIYTVIAGKPNTGKSSLLNMILSEERAIVTSVEGTTRDRIEEDAVIGKIRLRIADTAGIRESDSEAESIGIKMSIDALNNAELVLAVFDSSSPKDEKDEEFLKILSKIGCAKIAVMNKNDKENRLGEIEGFDRTVFVSALNKSGKEELEEAISSLFIDGSIDYDKDAVIVNSRQRSEIEKALYFVSCALDSLTSGFTPDIAGTDIESAMKAIGECDGRQVSEDIANNIFSRFCVGK